MTIGNILEELKCLTSQTAPNLFRKRGNISYVYMYLVDFKRRKVSVM